MAKVKIQGHASGTGVLTVTAPNTSTDRTITLPDSTGTLATTADSVGGANGVDFNDNVKARFGNDNELEIYSDGTTSWIKETHASGDLHIQGKEIALKMSNGENSAIFREDGGVELMHNAVQKLETTATGVSVTGTVTQSGNKTQIFNAQYDGTTTGTTTLSNIGFKPMALWCLFKVNNASVASWGFAGRQGGQGVLYDNKIHASSTHWASDSSYIGRLRFGSSNDVNLAVTTWNDNEIVLTRSKGGSGNSSACAYKILVMG